MTNAAEWKLRNHEPVMNHYFEKCSRNNKKEDIELVETGKENAVSVRDTGSTMFDVYIPKAAPKSL